MQKKRLGAIVSMALIGTTLVGAVGKANLTSRVAEKGTGSIIEINDLLNANLPDAIKIIPKEELEEKVMQVRLAKAIAEEQARIEAEERARKEAEEKALEEERQRILANRIYCKFEVSFYTTAPDEGSGTGIGASGEYVQPWVSIALPSDIPFYSTAYIEGLGEFVNHDSGSYIQWTYDEYGNLVCRVDVCVSSKSEAYSLGRFVADGYIDLAQ